MKITQQFFEEFLNGSEQFLELGMRVLKLELLLRVYGGMVPLSVIFKEFTATDIEYFLTTERLDVKNGYGFIGNNIVTEVLEFPKATIKARASEAANG